MSKKPTAKKMRGLRLPAEIDQAVAAAAEKERRTWSNMAEVLILEALETRKKKK